MDRGFKLTWHMTSNWDWFYTYEPISSGSIFIKNNHALEVDAVGTIKIKMYDDIVRTVEGVRHLNNLKKNLLSIGQSSH